MVLGVSNQSEMAKFLGLYAVSISLGVVNTPCPDVQYLRVPVMGSPTTGISSCFDSMAAKIHSVGTGGVGCCCAALLGRAGPHRLLLHRPGRHPRLGRVPPSPTRPNKSSWQQVIRYQYKLFGIHRLRVLSPPLGVLPDVYENEVRVMLLL
ncbi:PREDICTED: dual specificity protein phosphatase 18-like [Cariama cristata]|uniref:dual specificity protein phosphatase 18-like n=1 Tax=Cariama cristata TaxID=54380 RepID=UPI0005209350|nr:PREDICTED: dual specificity protein phosphatase 18-like [Cariama cristata]